MVLWLTTTILLSFLLLIIVHYILSVLLRHRQLLKEYRNISLLPLSCIPFIGNLQQVPKQPNVFFQLLCRLSKQSQEQGHGLFCLWYSLWPMVFLSSGRSLESFINNNKQLVKSFHYALSEPWLGTGLVNSNHEKWRSRRRLITPSFHDTQLLHNFVLIFNEQSSVLVRRLDEYAKHDNKSHDLHPYLSQCTLDIIAETATGTHPNAQLNEGENEFVRATKRISNITTIRQQSPWLWPSFVFNHSSLGREQTELLKVLHGFSRKVIAERLATFKFEVATNKKCSRRLVFLDSLIAHMEVENLSLDDIQEEIDTFMFAGHDTVATAMNFVCYLVGCHLDVQQKIHDEMDLIFGDDQERPCMMEDIEQMTYLDCVIKETMRLLTVVPFIMREVQEDFVSGGQTIRKGTTVLIFIHGIHQDASVFPNPEKFDPERFHNQQLISDGNSPFAYIPFSAGSRNCIGQRFAALEQRVVLSKLFRQFSFHSTQTIDDLRLASEITLSPLVPIQMIVERR